MRTWRSCLTIIGVGFILIGFLLLIAFVVGYDPAGVSGRLGVNLLLLGLFLVGFWALGAGLVFFSIRASRKKS